MTNRKRQLLRKSLPRLTVLLFIVLLTSSQRPAVEPVRTFPRLPTPTGLNPQSCRPCHSKKYESYIKTAHFLTSSLPSDETVRGSLAEGRNILRTRNPNTYFKVEKRDDSFFQVAHWKVDSEVAPFRSRREQIAVVVGAGVEGQSYLYWKDGFLYQLPVSYLSGIDEWVNSPGFPDGEVFFERPVTPRCLECHGTYFELEGTLQRPRYRDNYQLGIACWKCHGDGGPHIAKHASDKPIDPAQDIVNPAKLSPPRQLDICALCHSGVGQEKRPNFTFRPGQDLSTYLHRNLAASGEQVEEPGGWLANKLFGQSKCFTDSEGATCSTCHEVHLPESDLATMSRKCQQCHDSSDCVLSGTNQAQFEDLCIDCHMPDQASRRLRVHRTDETLSPLYRNHRIAIYPDATDAVLDRLSQSPED